MRKSRSFRLKSLLAPRSLVLPIGTLGVVGSLFALSLLLNIVLIHERFTGSKVAVVYDGDSFELNDGQRVRLLGVDAPEKGRCGYDEATKELRASVLGKKVRLKHTIVDDYGRHVSIVIAEDWGSWTKYLLGKFGRFFGLRYPAFDTLINRKMVALGLAKNLSVASPYKDVIDQADNDAKAQSLGIYSPRCRSLISRSNCTIKGNLQPEGKVYFKKGCPYYDQVVVDESFGDVWLCSESQAHDMGFILSKTCGR